MSYLIDGDTVPGSAWGHTPMPGRPQTDRDEQFPGVAQRLAVVGPITGNSLHITGLIEGTGATAAAAIAALDEAVFTYAAMRADVVTHEVQIHDYVFTDARLVQFAVAQRAMEGRSIGVVRTAEGEPKKVMARVEFLWRNMS